MDPSTRFPSDETTLYLECPLIQETQGEKGAHSSVVNAIPEITEMTQAVAVKAQRQHIQADV